MNEQILAARDGDMDTPVDIPGIKGATLFSGVSGYLQNGNYIFECRKAEWLKKAEGKTGKNLHVEWRVVEPEAFKGVPVHAYHPAPVGDPATDSGFSFLRQIILSNASIEGTLEQLTTTVETIPGFTPRKLISKRVAARTELGEGEYANRAGIGGYIGLDDYKAAPGPSGGGSFAPQPGSKPQTKTPELSQPQLQQPNAPTPPMPPNGTGAGVQKVLGW